MSICFTRDRFGAMAGYKIPERYQVLTTALAICATASLAITCVAQNFIPPLAKVPGFLICAGGDMAIILRRRDSYGLCNGIDRIPYAVVMLVSLVVWAVITSPLALVIARRRARKPT